MLLTIATTHRPATDLGFLLHKHPDRFQTFELPFGNAYVGYTEATEDRCEAVLVVDVDPIALTRRGKGGRTLYDYVNDRPYVGSSFLSVAIGRVFGSALKGRSDSRSDLADVALPLEVGVDVIRAVDGEALVRGLFEPLGYEVALEHIPLDAHFPQWGDSSHYRLRLTGRLPLQLALSHLYVLLPVLDDAKHYWVGDDEIDKLLRYGGQWLTSHPLRDDISHRYLRRRRHLSRQALDRMAEDMGGVADGEDHPVVEVPRLRDLRLDAVVRELVASGANNVGDFGCGEGALVERLMAQPQFDRIVASDVSLRVLKRARDRLRLEQLAQFQRDRVAFVHSALTYSDPRLVGLDAVALVEVVEHMDTARLPSFELAIFGAARPRTVVLTTPNADHNVRFDGLRTGGFRHDDHRFEWTRLQFRGWTEQVCAAYGYTARIELIGVADEEVGAPTQMVVFTRNASGRGEGS